MSDPILPAWSPAFDPWPSPSSVDAAAEGGDGPVATKPEGDAPRPDLVRLLLSQQVRGEEKTTFDGPLWFDAWMTRTEAELLERLRSVDGNGGLLRFREVAVETLEHALAAYPPPAALREQGREEELDYALNDGHADAYRHAYWSARLAQEFGAGFAESFTTAHEGGVDNEPFREAMDLHNNALGLAVVAAHPTATRDELDTEVRRRIASGEALVQRSDGAIEWSDRVAVGAHGHEPGTSTLQGLGLQDLATERTPAPWHPPPGGTRVDPDPVTLGDVLFRTDNVDVALPGGLHDYVDPFELIDYALAETGTPRFELAHVDSSAHREDVALVGIGLRDGVAASDAGEHTFDGSGFVGIDDGELVIDTPEQPFSDPLESPRVPRLLFGGNDAAGEYELADVTLDDLRDGTRRDTRG